MNEKFTSKVTCNKKGLKNTKNERKVQQPGYLQQKKINKCKRSLYLPSIRQQKKINKYKQ